LPLLFSDVLLLPVPEAPPQGSRKQGARDSHPGKTPARPERAQVRGQAPGSLGQALLEAFKRE
jgi:hypothetical protein